MSLYENCKLPIRICQTGFILIAIGFLIQNESVNVFYTFTNKYVLMFAQGCQTLGSIIIVNLPLIFMLYLVCKKANSGIPIILALIGYFAFLITTSLFADQSLSSYAYASNLGVNAIIDTASITKYPLETGLIGSFIVAYITRYAFIRSRHRTSHSILGFLNKDTAAIIYNTVYCVLAGIVVSFVFPFLYTYLSQIIANISKDLADPIRIALYGALDRTLSILGLGNIIRYPFWYTALGGSYQTISGQSIIGDVNIWSYVKDTTGVFQGAGRFITPYYVINLFMVPAIYLGIMSSITDKFERRYYRLPFLGAILLSIIAGNPLPIELTIALTSPLLLLVYILLVAVVFGYLSFANVFLGSNIGTLANTSTALPGNFPDFIINIRSALHYDDLIIILIVGVIAGVIMYIVCRIYYRHIAFNLINHNRDDEVIDNIVEAIGGYDNIRKVGSGFFRVNLSLSNNEEVSIERLQDIGAVRITETKTGISMQCGSSAYIIAKTIDDKLKAYLKEKTPVETKNATIWQRSLM